MSLPDSNRHKKDIKEEFGENAKLLEEQLASINWKVFAKAWAVGLSAVCITVFAILFFARLAFIIF